MFEGGSLKVVTTNFRDGYLRNNGVPYSENASLTEHFDRLPCPSPNGDVWLIVSSILEDPTYLNQPLYLSTQFKKEPNGAKWNPDAVQDGSAVGAARVGRCGDRI